MGSGLDKTTESIRDFGKIKMGILFQEQACCIQGIFQNRVALEGLQG